MLQDICTTPDSERKSKKFTDVGKMPERKNLSVKFMKRSSDKENPHQRTKEGHPVVQRRNTINNQEISQLTFLYMNSAF